MPFGKKLLRYTKNVIITLHNERNDWWTTDGIRKSNQHLSYAKAYDLRSQFTNNNDKYYNLLVISEQFTRKRVNIGYKIESTMPILIICQPSCFVKNRIFDIFRIISQSKNKTTTILSNIEIVLNTMEK